MRKLSFLSLAGAALTLVATLLSEYNISKEIKEEVAKQLKEKENK